MSVTININGENAGEALKELSVLAAGIAGAPASTEQTKIEKPVKGNRTTKAAEKVDPAPSREEDDQSADDQEDIPSVVDLRAKAQEVGKTPEAKKAIKALLDTYGVKAISDVPEDQRVSFLADLDLV